MEPYLGHTTCMKERNRKIRTPCRIQIHELMNIVLEFCCCAETTALLLSNKFPHSKTTEQSCLGRILSGMKQKFFRSLSLSLPDTIFCQSFFFFSNPRPAIQFQSPDSAVSWSFASLLSKLCNRNRPPLSISLPLSLSSTCPHSFSDTHSLTLSERERGSECFHCCNALSA